MTEENLPIDTIDYLMIKWKKLASWESPKTSAATVGIVTLIYWYLNWTDATATNLILSAILYMYLGSTFAQTIWPEIRSDDQSNSQVHANEDEVQKAVEASEISFMIEGTKNYYTVLKDLRSDSPGLFCVFTSGVLMLLGYSGTYFTMLPLMYAVTICGLVMPIALRKSPWIVQQIVNYSYVVGNAIVEIQKKQIHIVWIDYFKQFLNQIMDKISNLLHVIKQKTASRKNPDKNVTGQESNEVNDNDGDLKNKEVQENAEHLITNQDEENVEDQIIKQVDETSEDVLEKIDNNNSLEQQQEKQNVSADSN